MKAHHRLSRGALASAALVFMLSCGLFAVTTQVIRVPPAWLTFEFCQYAEIGRNLARDGSFGTDLAEPMALAYIDQHHVHPAGRRWPVIDRYPLPAVTIALLMRLFGATDLTAAWSNGLAISLLAALTYWIARAWYGPGWAAVVSLLFLANPAIYGSFLLLGTPDVWFAVAFTLELWAFAGLLESPVCDSRRAALLGATAGIAYLARFNVVLFVVIQGAALLARRRWRDALTASAVGLVVVAPLFGYNISHFGTPVISIYSTWNVLDGIGAYQLEPWLYYELPDLPTVLRAHGAGLARKVLGNLLRVVPVRIWSLWHLFVLLPLALVAPATLRREPTAQRRFLVWAAGLFGVQLIVFSALRLELENHVSPYHGRYFFWFAAPALLLAVGLLRCLAGEARWRRALAGTLVIAQLAAYGPGWQRWAAERYVDVNLGHDPIRQMLARNVPRSHVVASNQPQLLVWYSGLKAISLPADPAELERLNRVSPTPVDYLFVDGNYNSIQMGSEWSRLFAPWSVPPSSHAASFWSSYEYALPHERTRPLGYVLLRRRGLPRAQAR